MKVASMCFALTLSWQSEVSTQSFDCVNHKMILTPWLFEEVESSSWCALQNKLYQLKQRVKQAHAEKISKLEWKRSMICNNEGRWSCMLCVINQVATRIMKLGNDKGYEVGDKMLLSNIIAVSLFNREISQLQKKYLYVGGSQWHHRHQVDPH